MQLRNPVTSLNAIASLSLNEGCKKLSRKIFELSGKRLNLIAF